MTVRWLRAFDASWNTLHATLPRKRTSLCGLRVTTKGRRGVQSVLLCPACTKILSESGDKPRKEEAK